MVTSVEDILKEFNLEKTKISENNNPANNEEKLIMEALENDPLSIDKIIEKTNLSAQVVATTLAIMEISGKVSNLKGNTYSLN